MTSPDVISTALKNMDDASLMDRWQKGLFSDEALPIARAEMERRGFDAAAATIRVQEHAPQIRPRRPIWSIYIPVILLNALVAGLFLAKANPLDVLSFSIKNPSHFLTLIAGGLGAFLVYFAVGSIVEFVVASVMKRPKTFLGCLVWATLILLLMIVVSPR